MGLYAPQLIKNFKRRFVMKKVLGTLAAGTLLATGLVNNANATKPLDELKFKFGVQHRVMYKYSLGQARMLLLHLSCCC
jgi:hypothetical protein